MYADNLFMSLCSVTIVEGFRTFYTEVKSIPVTVVSTQKQFARLFETLKKKVSAFDDLFEHVI